MSYWGIKFSQSCDPANSCTGYVEERHKNDAMMTSIHKLREGDGN